MIYFICDGRYIKIGYSGEGVKSDRLKALQGANARKLTTIFRCSGDRDDEKELHRLFSACGLHHRNEWFVYGPAIRNFVTYCRELGLENASRRIYCDRVLNRPRQIKLDFEPSWQEQKANRLQDIWANGLRDILAKGKL